MFIKVVKRENVDDGGDCGASITTTTDSLAVVSIQVEDDQTVQIAKLVRKFPGAIGLEYDADGHKHILQCISGRMFCDDWSKPRQFHPLYTRGGGDSKRKMTESVDGCASDKQRRIESPTPIPTVVTATATTPATTNNHLPQPTSAIPIAPYQSPTTTAQHHQSPQCTDLIVLGINYKSSEDSVRSYFEQFGPLNLCEIKRDYNGASKGFGFIRFRDYKAQTRVLKETHHVVDGRACQVKIPESKHGPNNFSKAAHSMRKIFVARLPQGTTTEDLRTYFSQFGDVVDVYIGQPFRAFGFVTFRDTSCIPLLYSQQHFLNGASLHIGPAEPKGSTVGQNLPNNHVHEFRPSTMATGSSSTTSQLLTALQQQQSTSSAATQNWEQNGQTMATFLAHAIQQKMNKRPDDPSFPNISANPYDDVASATAAAVAVAAAAQQHTSGELQQRLATFLAQPSVMAGFLSLAVNPPNQPRTNDPGAWEAAAAAAMAAAAASSVVSSNQNPHLPSSSSTTTHHSRYYDPSNNAGGPNQNDPSNSHHGQW